MKHIVLGYLVITNVSPEEWRAKVLSRSQTIGRNPDCEIPIPMKHRQVSRKHARIEYLKDVLTIQDLGSSCGTKLNGVPLVPNRPTELVIGDRLWFAGLELHFISERASILEHLVDQSSKNRPSSGSIQECGVQPIGAGMKFEDSLRELSAAELDIVRWISRGTVSDREIGLKLIRSHHTIRTQLSSIFQKLGVHSREELISLLKQREISWTKPADGIVDIEKTEVPDDDFPAN